MKQVPAVMLAFALAFGGAASAEQPMSRGDYMRACAAQWRSQGHHSHGMRYQHFLSQCMKRLAGGR